MTKVIIIDDEPLARSLVREGLSTMAGFKIVAECGDGFEGMKSIQQHTPDLIFLDIQMPKISGFEMLELLEKPPAVIFITAFDEFAIKAFEANAVDYLLKPFSQERFEAAIKKFITKRGGEPEIKSTQKLLETVAQAAPQNMRIVVKSGNKIKIISLPEVIYFEAADDYVNVVTAEGSFLKNKTMNFFEHSLDPLQFVRIHRSYILNVQHITRIEVYEKENYVAILKSGKQIPVSKSGYARMKEVLGM
ncbi:MAG: response regulator [Chitinophagales bacterium]|nr:response regulator [Chitinophagales bacterium]